MADASNSLSAGESPRASIPVWYRARLRPLLQASAPIACTELDEASQRARPGNGRFTETRIGVLGEAGVGKSTLLNALLSDRLQLLPQGGVGPLTARAIEIRHAHSPFLNAHCFGRERVRELAAALQTDSLAPGVTPTDTAHQKRMARLMALGSQFSQAMTSDVQAFVDACLADQAPTPCDSEQACRLRLAREVISIGDSASPRRHIEAGVDFPGFLTSLRDHAAGPLAPLTRSIEIGWDAALLAEGAVLIDLPGLGVANDIYRAHTLAAATQVQALVLVVDRSGLTQAAAKLLEESQFLVRMAEQAQRAAPADLQLLVAVTKLDQVASEATAASRSAGRPGINWPEALAIVTARAEVVLRSQLEMELTRTLATYAPGIRARLRQRVAIVPVFPVDHQRLYRADPEEPTRFTNANATGIVKLRDRLRRLAVSQHVDLTVLCFRALSALAATHSAQATLLKQELRSLITSMQGIET